MSLPPPPTGRSYFTASNYNIIAFILQRFPKEATKWEIIEALAGTFVEDNPRFRKEQFYRACMQENEK